jgi:DNA-binding CsgD family transcriptional regulator
MKMSQSLKEQILNLRKLGKTYKEIGEKLNCKKEIISYHCRMNDLGGNGKEILNEDVIIELNRFYENHTAEECAIKFNISKSSVIRYVDNKRIKLTDEERRIKNYERVKNYRQKLKERAIEYKGGCCEKCGYNKCKWVFEFHHLKPSEKDFNLSSYTNLSWVKTKNELDKCIMVCANCHREIHYDEYMTKFNK